MTPKHVTTIDLKELKEVELKCECGAAIRLPLPIKENLVAEQICPGCPRPMWAHLSPAREKAQRLLLAISDWNNAGYPTLSMRFVLTEEAYQRASLVSSI
jgi:hypothetical protein